MNKLILSMLMLYLIATMTLAVDCFIYVKDSGLAPANYSFVFGGTIDLITRLMDVRVGHPVPQAEVRLLDSSRGGRSIGFRTNEEGLCFFSAATGDEVKIYRKDYNPLYFKIPDSKGYPYIGVLVNLEKR